MTIYTKPSFNTVWADRGDAIRPSDLKIARGWVVEIPPHEQFNWWMKRVDSFLIHMNQRGIPAWDGTMQYYANLSYVQDATTGVVYRCIQDSMNNAPAVSATFWVEAFMGRNAAYTKTEIDNFRATDRNYVDSTFLKISNNLSDVPNKAQARANLQIFSSTESNGRFLQITNNLSELTDVLAARTKLQVYSKTETDTLFMKKSANLADLENKTVSRANLGLGNSATLNVGQTGGTVAAGDDYRIVNATPMGRGVWAGVGLVGGGDFTVNRTISMGAPGTCSPNTPNAAYGDGSHTHAVSINVPGFLPGKWRNVTGARGSGGTYYNGLGRGMYVAVSTGNTVHQASITFVVDGVEIYHSSADMIDGGVGGMVFVPPGSSYTVHCSPGVSIWSETQ